MSIKDYIQGNRKGKDANRLERDAMNDPFLQDALEGFDAVSGNHVPVIERLENKFAQPAIEPQHSRNRFVYWFAAASVVLLTGISIYFLLEKPENTTTAITMLKSDENEKEKIITIDSSASQIIQKEELQHEVLALARTDKKVKQIQTKPSINFEENKILKVADDVITADEPVNGNFAETVAEVVERKLNNPQLIRGKVVDETGKPLDYVSVFVKEIPSSGVYTDDAGNYAINIPSGGQTLVFSSIGYTTQEIAMNNTSMNVALTQDNNRLSESIAVAYSTANKTNTAKSGLANKEQTVMLKPDATVLDEAIVVGFGSVKKSSMTGAVSVIKNDTDSRKFGKKQFKKWFKNNAAKNVCNEKRSIVKLSFFVDETGKPTNIEYKYYSCEAAKDEIENMLASSPTWTKTNRKVRMTIKW
jgi:DNA-binding response OmpR family regulator